MTEELWQAWNLIKQDPAEFIGQEAVEQCPRKRKRTYDQKIIQFFQKQMGFVIKICICAPVVFQIDYIYKVEKNIPTNSKLFSLYVTPLG